MEAVKKFNIEDYRMTDEMLEAWYEDNKTDDQLLDEAFEEAMEKDDQMFVNEKHRAINLNDFRQEDADIFFANTIREAERVSNSACAECGGSMLHIESLKELPLIECGFYMRVDDMTEDLYQWVLFICYCTCTAGHENLLEMMVTIDLLRQWYSNPNQLQNLIKLIRGGYSDDR